MSISIKVLIFLVLSLVVFTGCASVHLKPEDVKFRQLNAEEMSHKHFCEVRNTLFDPDSKSSAYDYDGKTYYFCCTMCEDVFTKNIGKFIREVHHDSGSMGSGPMPGMNSGSGGGGHSGGCH